MSDSKNEKQKDSDPELDDLLDSALQDMTKKNEVAEQPKQTTEVPQNMWSEEFIKEAAAQFESNMASLIGTMSGMPEDQITQEQITQTFSKMAEAAAQVLKPGDDANGPMANTEGVKIDEVSAAISQTLQNLSSNAENLQTPFNDQDLANMFNNFNIGEGQEGNMFLPFMQGMMQSLLSKEVLYPSLKELLDKYPAWLEENKAKLEASEFDRYSQQKDLMQKICAELEPEQESDPDDVKQKRFQVVLEMMQKMQDLGQPPTELVGDMAAPPTGFAPPENPDPSQCSII